MNISEQIARFERMKLEEAKKEKKRLKKEKKKYVCIDPDSVIGKEITYQTALLHEIREYLREENLNEKRNSEESKRKKYLNDWLESYQEKVQDDYDTHEGLDEINMLKENTERHPDKCGDQGGNDKELEIIILFKNPEIIPLMNEFIEERIMEIYRRHPYVKIHIEVEA